MHPFGCFGSSLAFAPKTAVCQACDRRVECEALVTARRPQMLRLLSRFTDSKGEFMAFHWLTPAEKKKVKAARKLKAQQEIERQVYGDPSVVMGLKATIDFRTQPLLDRMTKARINVKRDSLEAVGGFSTELGVIIAKLRARPRTVMELTDMLASECSLTHATARRDTTALLSILDAADRIQRVGPNIELK